MRYSAVLFLILAFSLTAFSQPRNPKVKPKPKASPVSTADEKAEFEKALGEPDAASKIAALQKFMQDFPNSKEIAHAQESIVSARGVLGDNALQAGDTANGIEFFKLAVKDAPATMSEKLFVDVVLQFPTNLFLRNQRDAAREIAMMIEEKIGNNTRQILGLATFYIGIENATNARRLAQKAIEIAPETAAAYQTLGIANRLGFRIDEAAAAYAKALELDPTSVVSKRSLAEMKRADGKSGEAAALYREVLEKNPADANAKTGLILSIFESGKQTEAETEMQKSLETNARDLPLLVGAAYFYAAHNDGAKAVEFAQKALAVEPRYTWASIALARGFLVQRQPLEAEKVLLAARAFGNFPTLDYEIASARLQAGLYREAADELKRNFAVKNGVLETYLGNRVGVDAEDFIKLLSLERRAAIFSFETADTTENAERLKSLLEFAQEIDGDASSETALSEAADKFVKGDDKMKIHRQLFVAGRLLDAKKNLPKVIELAQESVKGVNTALDVPNPAAAVMADELYKARQLASARGEFLLVPDVPRQTLSAILRGRIEEISGWTLYQQDKPADAVVKLKRAVSVLPEKSSWWRSSVWRLGSALEADGKLKEALDNYIKSYKDGEPNAGKYAVIEILYQKVNGNRDGLEEKIGKQPESVAETVAKVTETTTPAPETSPTPATETTPTPQEIVESKTEKTEETKPPITETPSQTETVATPTPEPTIEPTPESTPEASPEPTPEASPVSQPVPANEETSKNSSTESITNPVTKNPPTDEATPTNEATPTPSPETIVPAVQISETPSPQTENIQPPITSETPNTEIVAKTDPATKPLFDPVVIVVGRNDASKKEVVKTETVNPSPAMTEETTIPKPAETQKVETKTNDDGYIRPRVIIEDRLKPSETAKCGLVASQESVWLTNGGGGLGLLVGFAGKGDATQITGVSSSPQDVEVKPDPEMIATAGRAIFVIKSISTKKGTFTAMFDSPCGKTEVQVKVR